MLPLTFGGGLSTLRNPGAIDIAECADESQNFDLSTDLESFRVRNAVDLKHTAPNGAEIRGIGELIATNGTIYNWVQAGGTVYSVDENDTYTEIGTVNSGSRLRGGRFQTSLVDDVVIITDLDKLTPVKKWDGTTFQDLAHNLGSDFFAKYCLVLHERAFYGNVSDSTTALPHLLVGSGRGATASTTDIENLSVSDRPSSALSEADPFYIPAPDLKPINGIFDAFGKLGVSTENGRIWYLSGDNAKDFAITDLYLGSAASGDEAVISAGNDVIYGRRALIESLISTDTFGETDADDLSRFIQEDIKDVQSWRLVYNPSMQKVYAWPDGLSDLWVWSKTRAATSQVSPWSLWKTAAGLASFATKAAATVRRASDGLDVVWFGGPEGQIYELDGHGGQDAGTDDIAAVRVSALVSAPRGSIIDVHGFIRYKRQFSGTVTITFEYAGVSLFDESITLTIPAQTGGSVWGGSSWWGDAGTVWGLPFAKRLSRQHFGPVPGRSNEMQVRIAYTGNAGFEIQGGEIRFKAATT